jgi:probable HAF family extracellular repeat protein
MEKQRTLAGYLLAATLGSAFAPAAAQTPSFQGLGQMPGAAVGAGTYSSTISGDGSTIMGYGWVCANGQSKCNSTDTVQAYRWAAAGGFQILGSPSNSDFFGAGAVSYNGAAIAGEHPLGNATTFEAFRWTAARGMMQLPMNIASAITPDGSMLAGGDNWCETSGQAGTFGPFPGEQGQTQAYGLAGTGQAPVAVGAAIKGSDDNGATFHAFRWTPAAGLQDLGLATGTQSIATAISADGRVIVGEATDASRFWRAFRWTASTGIEDIGTLGGPESAPVAVNADGTVIVGFSLTSGESAPNACFVWTAKTGMQNLLTLLQSTGVHTADNWVSLVELNGVSASATIMAGYGQSPRSKDLPFGTWEPFRVVLPVP